MTWRQLTLGQICAEGGGGIQTGPFGSQLHASDYVTDGLPSVMPQNIGDNRIDPNDIARVSPEDMERLERYWLSEGDIVYSRRGDVERRALVRPENEGWLCGTGCLRVRIGDPNVHDPAFVSYALGLADSRKWIVQHAVGATMLNLNTGILGAVPLRVPTLPVQRGIAEVLGAIDDKIAANANQRRVTADLMQASFDACGADRSVEQGSRLDELIEVNPSRPMPRDREAVYLEMKQLPQDEMTVAEWSHRPPRGGARFRNGDTLLARITPCLENGKTGFVDFLGDSEIGIGSTEYIVLRSRDQLPEALTYFLAKTPRFRDFAIKRMVGTSGRQRLSGSDLVDYPLGALDEDRVQAFAGLSDALLPRLKASVDEDRRLRAARDSLLPLLMSGKVRVKDAESVVGEVL